MTNEFKPTTQQQAILDEIRQGTGHMSIVARAGCGKTSTILLAVDAIAQAFPGSETTVCAFNKAIADEVKEKLADRGHTNWRTVNAATLHSLGFGLVRFVFQSPKIDDKKVLNIVKGYNDALAVEYRQQIVQLVKLAKGEGFGFFDDRAIGDIGRWYDMADHYQVNGFEDTTQLDDVIALAQRAYRDSLKQTDVIDFDDMVLFPLIKNLRVKFQKDFLFVDEAQDLSRTRQALARKFVKPTGRVIIVGDDRQAIYGFSGADSDALTNLTTQLNAKVLPLSVTWRCPKNVVSLAQSLVDDIEAAETAPEGTVSDIALLPEGLGAETAILCRNTAPLIEMAYSLIRQGVACKVEGRDIGEGLKTLTRRWKVKSIDKFLVKLDEYESREIQKANAKGKEEKAEQIGDKCTTLRIIAEECGRLGGSTVEEMETYIDQLFADGATNCTVLATYHRSKGREWDRVVLLEHATRCPSKWARLPWQVLQEENLAYVAFTRAKSELLFLG